MSAVTILVFEDLIFIFIIVIVVVYSCYLAIKRYLLDVPWIRNLTTNIQVVPAQLVESSGQLQNEQVLPQVPNLP